MIEDITMPKILRIILIIVAALAVIGLLVWWFMLRPVFAELEEVRQMEIAHVELAAIPDGDYPGSFEYAMTEVKVLVFVRDHQITDVRITGGDFNEYGEQAREGVIEMMIAQNSPVVEVVTGATTTSKAIMKAVENALTTALKTAQSDR